MEKKVSDLLKLSDAELAARAKDKNTDAFFAIEIRYEERVFRHVLKSVLNIPLAHDITSETFDIALKRFQMQQYREEGKLLNWLFRIAQKIHAQSIRRKTIYPEVSIDAGDTDVPDRSGELTPREANLRIGKAIHGCTQKERIPFILYFIKLKGWEEIGVRLGIEAESAAKPDTAAMYMY
jgi:DNA-directed RNA polymerase specialized sigma24 family protein